MTAGVYLPIEEHGVIGDLHTVALVGTDGTVDWYCPPRFDSPSVFASLVDADRGGFFRIAPDRPAMYKSKQLYLPDTNVLITRFLGPDGVGEVQDFMPIQAPHAGADRQDLVRRVVGVRGQLTMRVELQPRFNYARHDHEVEVVAGSGALFRSPELTLALSTDLPIRQVDHGVVIDLALPAGEAFSFLLESGSDIDRPRPLSEADAQALLEQTGRFWREWLSGSRYHGRWRETVNRSALTLKLLTYRPTGALIAAPTTSLPERVSGGRNWDYRYTWIRDSAFSLYALLRLGFIEEAQSFFDWLRRVWVSSTDSDGTGPLQIMYGIDGRRDLPEYELAHFEGYRGSAPVRIGNAATGQVQLDIYGELLDAVYLSEQHGLANHYPRLSYDSWNDLARMVDWVSENWDQADEGIWEVRNQKQPFTYSRLMCWVALERGVRIATRRSFPADVVHWMSARDMIFRRIIEHSWDDTRRAFVQYEGSSVLDASLLLMPLVHFLSPTDPRWLGTLDAIGETLVSDSLVYRYDPRVAPDGLEGGEGTFSMCSFWYVECLARAGLLDEARLGFEKMLSYANHLGLYSEQLGPSGEALGNFPQAFTHLSLISAAINLDRLLG